MSETKYTYSIQNDFPNHIVNPSKLIKEIIASNIVTDLESIKTNNDDCDIWFVDILSSEDETILDGIVAAHDGAVLNDYKLGCKDCEKWYSLEEINFPSECPVCSGSNIQNLTDEQFKICYAKEEKIIIQATSFHSGSSQYWRVYSVPILRFDADVEEEAYVNFEIPDSIDLSVNPKIYLRVFPYENQTSGSDFIFICKMKYVAESEAYDKSDDEIPSTTITVSNTERVRTTSAAIELDASKIEVGDDIQLRVVRDATNENDDRNGDACLVEAIFVYTKKKMG